MTRKRRKTPFLQKLVALVFLGLVLLEEQLIRWLTRDGNRTFFDPAEFPWVAQLEASWPAIRAELDGVLPRIDLIPAFQDIQIEQRFISTDDGWKTFFFCGYGSTHAQNVARCPRTHQLLQTIPGLTTAFFSILQPGKRLKPHRGPYKGVLRYHLALKVPSEASTCGIRVGADEASWQEGKSLVFDDTHVHTAWNDSEEVRVVLFVDFVRPLPAPLSLLNRWTLSLIGRLAFVQKAAERLDAWEARFGEELDRAREAGLGPGPGIG